MVLSNWGYVYAKFPFDGYSSATIKVDLDGSLLEFKDRRGVNTPEFNVIMLYLYGCGDDQICILLHS